MQRSLFVLTFTIAALFAGASCERHSFEQTKVLHQAHGSHGEGEAHPSGEGAGHENDHGTKEHDSKEQHGEKKGGDSHQVEKGEPRKTGI